MRSPEEQLEIAEQQNAKLHDELMVATARIAALEEKVLRLTRMLNSHDQPTN